MIRRIAAVAAVASAILSIGPGAAGALEVKLTVTETDKVARTPAAVTTGVPFAKGALADAGKLAVKAGGKALPAQFLKTVAWDDGSVRWALMDVQVDVPAGGKVELALSDSGANPAPASPVKVDDGAEAVKVSTGPLEFTVGKKSFNLFQSLKVDGKELLTSAGKGLVVVKTDGGEVLAGPPAEVKIEQAGPMRAIVCARGKFPEVHNDLLGYTARITAFAGQKFVKVQVWLENGGAVGYFRAKGDNDSAPNAEWFAFKGMRVDLGLGQGGSSASCEGVDGTGSFKVLQLCRQAKGGKRERGRPVYAWDDFEYLISSGGKELKKGDRTDGVVEVKGGAGKLTAAVRDFWQNYDKAIELEGGSLRLWLWPLEGQWPRPRTIYDANNGNPAGSWKNGMLAVTDGPYNARTSRLQGLAKDGGYLLSGSVHKGHEFVLDFSGRAAAETAAELSAPLLALASAEYCAGSEAVPAMFAPPEVRTADKDCNAKLAAWNRMAVSAADPAGTNSIWKARQYSVESATWYVEDSCHSFGWMDYGDICVPARGPASLHGDWPWIMWLDLLRTGNLNFARLAVPMARHRIDVDQFWSDRDLPEIRGLQRPDFNFPGSHCGRLCWVPDGRGNWLAGAALHYMLTGEPKALETCARNAAGLKALWEWIAKAKPYAGPQGDMAATGWSILSYCTMYDLTADKKWLDDAMALFKANVMPKWQALGPFLHDPYGQIQSQDYIQEDAKYCHAIVPFCELHRRTGDETVMKLLKEGCDKSFTEGFFEAPRFLADLYAYVGMKTGNKELLERAADQFAGGFPLSKCPPVFVPDSITWSYSAAMTLRAGHLLQYAYWKQGGK
jgi:hypothetical protein